MIYPINTITKKVGNIMNKKIFTYLILFSITGLTACSNGEKKATSSTSLEPKKETVKKKTKESSSSSSKDSTETTSTVSSEKTVETQIVEMIPEETQEVQTQPISDMPPSWYGTPEEWEVAKTQGWTAEGYEEQVRASQNESNPIQPGDPNYVWPYELDNQRNEFFNEFYSEHGREPTSGEIQSAWAKEQGWE